MPDRKRRAPVEKPARSDLYPILVRDAVNRFVMIVFTADWRQRGRTIWLSGTVDDDA
jgi:hypothetical protein